MTVLVTGGTGFVGSAIVRALIARGERPRCLVRRTSDRRNLAGLAVDLVEGDLAQEESLDGALKGCEALFHVAADYRIWARRPRSEEHTSELQSLMRISYAVFCLKKKKTQQ